jgi:lipopolysaccharide transport system ATP-binding protein
MSDIAIKVEGLGKQYRLGEIGTGTISHDLNRWWARLRGKEDPFATVGEVNDRTSKSTNNDYVWSLRDINFEVKKGEVLGIIGRNGAGKSTLLKILSKVTAPTTGKIKVNGRIASLLEVGTGFHPELTGRENIFLNGAILGMTKTEIRSKFDEIVDFSGVERYIDTPVKRYSSGMYVRLAFAVSAFLEPEILIVDEVLAVGDAEFQKKCLGRMKDVSVNDGRTVLFVSHNMAAVKTLCTQGLFMSNGMRQSHGEIDKVLDEYMNHAVSTSTYIKADDVPARSGTKRCFFNYVKIHNKLGEPARDFFIGDDVYFTFGLSSNEKNDLIKIGLQLRTSDGVNVANMLNVDSGFVINNFTGYHEYTVCLKDVRLYPDTYYISYAVESFDSHIMYDYLEDCMSFTILGGGDLTIRNLPRAAGLLFLTPDWTQVS